MRYEFQGSQSFPLVKVWLDKDETVKAESGAMVAMSEGLELSGKMDGGIGKAIGRMFTGESFFLQNILAKDKAGWVLLATPVPGSITDMEISEGRELLVQKDGFLAATAGVNVSSKAQSLSKGLFGGEGFFVVKLSGIGNAFISTYGSMHEIEMADGEQVTVDNGHLVAWDSNLDYKITKGAKSWTSSLTSGEGLACSFTGPGKIIIQTRNPRDLGRWLYPFLPIVKQR